MLSIASDGREATMALFRDILDYLEHHHGLFVALGAIIGAVAAIVGMYLQYRHMRRERDEALIAVDRLNNELIQKAGAHGTETAGLIAEVNNLKAKVSELKDAGKRVLANRNEALTRI